MSPSRADQVFPEISTTSTPSLRPWRILSLDGGGVKGLAELLILERIFRTIKIQQDLNTVPLPCDYFDVICGTSTGGLIAILLGRLRLSVTDAIVYFKRLSSEVFPGKKAGVWPKAIKAVMGKPFFKGNAMEEAIHQLLIELKMDSESPFKEISDPTCKVFVCATRYPNAATVLLRNFDTKDPGESDYACKIWEAARATSAAPLFFAPFKIERLGITLGDGALRQNNPITEAISEAHRINKGRKLGSLVSIGTGIMDVQELDKSSVKVHQILKTCADISINCNDKAQEFARSPTGNKLLVEEPKRYFRFDVERGLDKVELEDWRRLDDVDAYVEEYLRRQQVAQDIALCASSLINPRIPLKPRNLPRDPNPDYMSSVTQMQNVNAMVDRSPLSFLYGLQARGVGVGEVAFRFAQNRQTQDENVFYLRGDQTQNFEEDLERIANDLNPENTLPAPLLEKVKKVRELLEDPAFGKWVLVVNKAENTSRESRSERHVPSLENFLPKTSNGRVLVASSELDVEVSRNRLTQPQSLEIGATRHIRLEKDEALLFKPLEILGRGGFSQIDLIQISSGSNKFRGLKEGRYARKSMLFRRRNETGDKKERERMLQEVEIMKHLRHQHIIRIIMSYETDQRFAIIMEPVGEINLAQLLTGHGLPLPHFKWLGCLASGIHYLHQKHIRHRDVKPANILIKGETVFLIDFGLSSVTSVYDDLDTGLPLAYTPRYAAPEVLEQLPRGSSVDIFSLGAVFLEIITILLGYPMLQLSTFRLERSTYTTYRYGTNEGLETSLRWMLVLFERGKACGKTSLIPAIQWTFDMMQPKQDARPTSLELCAMIKRTSQNEEDSVSCECLKDEYVHPRELIQFPSMPESEILNKNTSISWSQANAEWTRQSTIC